MKKIICFIALVGLFSMAAFAGTINPYIEVENVGTTFVPYYTLGAETSDSIGTSKWMFTADGSLYDKDLLKLQSPMQLDFGASLGWKDALELLDGGDVSYGLTFLIDETLIFKPGKTLKPILFEPSFGLEAFFGPVKAWVEAAFPYKDVGGTTGLDWTFRPTIGFSIGK